MQISLSRSWEGEQQCCCWEPEDALVFSYVKLEKIRVLWNLEGRIQKRGRPVTQVGQGDGMEAQVVLLRREPLLCNRQGEQKPAWMQGWKVRRLGMRVPGNGFCFLQKLAGRDPCWGERAIERGPGKTGAFEMPLRGMGREHRNRAAGVSESPAEGGDQQSAVAPTWP